MKNVRSIELIETLKKDTQSIIQTVRNEFNALTIDQQIWKPNPEKWSIAECLEHLNIYGRYYLPIITTNIEKANNQAEATYSSGLLGNYFVNAMLPKAGNVVNKMKTPTAYNPTKSKMENKDYLNDFLEQQETLLNLLEQSKKVNLQNTKIPISLSKWVKIKLGDTFRFIIAHNQRHILQAQKLTKQEHFPKN